MYQNNQFGNQFWGQQPNTGFGASQTFNLQQGFGGVGSPMPQQTVSLQQIQQALTNQILGLVNGSAGQQIDLITAANRNLMANGGNNQLFSGLVSMGAMYCDYVIRTHHQNPQQTIVNVANVMHGALVAGEKVNYQHTLHLYDPAFLQNLDAFTNEYNKIANTVRQLNSIQQQQQGGLITPQQNYQTVNSSLGGAPQQQQVAPGVVILSDTSHQQDQARVITAFDAAPKIAGLPPIGTIPTRQIRRADGSVVDLYNAAEEMNGTAPKPNVSNEVHQNHGIANVPSNATTTSNGMTILREDPTQAQSAWDIRQQQMQRSVGQISQEQENGVEVPITFNQPQYTNTPEPKNAADLLFDDVFGGAGSSVMPTGGWKGFTDFQAPDPDELAMAGIVKRGAASSDAGSSVFDDVEDAFIQEHYPDLTTNQSIASMDAFTQQVKASDMYPGTHDLSLMELSGNTNQIPQSNVGGIDMNNINEELVEDFHSMEPERKAAVLANKRNRHIAPVYVAGRSRVVVLKSLGGGKVTIEAKADMNYEIHETELLAPVKTPLTGQLGNPTNADTALTLALATANEAHYRKLLEEKSAAGEDLTDLMANGPMIEMSNLVAVGDVSKYAGAAQAALLERLGDNISEVSLDASINFNAFNPGRYVLSEDSLALALSITRAKTTATIVARALDFFEEGNLPIRENHRLHAAATDEVNRLLQITFHPDYHIDSFIHDADDIATLLHENEEENVRDTLCAIYQQAVKTVFAVHTLGSLKKRLADAEEETGLTDDEQGIFATITNVTLLPFNYADYPLAFEGKLGRITKENLPKLYEVMEGILKKRTAEGVYKFAVVTEDYQIIEFFKPILADDEAIYIARN